MPKNLAKLVLLILMTSLMFVFNQCVVEKGEVSELKFTDANMGWGVGGQGRGSAGGLSSLEAFKQTVYPITRNYCASCHAAQSPTHAHADPAVAHDTLLSQFKVSLERPESSRIYLKIADDAHNCWNDCAENGEEILDAIYRWVELMQGSEEEEVEEEDIYFSAACRPGVLTETIVQDRQDSIDAFENTVHIETTRHCNDCHGSGASRPRHASSDVEEAYNVVLNNYVNFDDLMNSRMLQKLATGHPSGQGNNLLPSFQQAFVEWAENHTGSLQVKTTVTKANCSERLLTAQSLTIKEIIEESGGKLRMDISALVGGVSTILSADINYLEGSDQAFTMGNVVIESAEDLVVKEIKILVNNFFDPSNGSRLTLVGVNEPFRVYADTPAILDESEFILTNIEGLAIDRLSFEFTELEVE